MGYIVFWISLALVAAVVVLIGASKATQSPYGSDEPQSTWAGLWESIRLALAPTSLSIYLGILLLGTKLGIARSPEKLAGVRAHRAQALKRRRVGKVVSDLAKGDIHSSESNTSLDDFLRATEIDEPAYFDVAANERMNNLYERYASRK